MPAPATEPPTGFMLKKPKDAERLNLKQANSAGQGCMAVSAMPRFQKTTQSLTLADDRLAEYLHPHCLALNLPL